MHKILVVDDEENIRLLLKYNLETSGYHVILGRNGGEALDLAMREKPNLILLDLMLPDLDGMEVCRRLKNENETTGIPVIMLTARSEEIDKVLGLEIGADDYITKPFSIREMMARINAILRRSTSFTGGKSDLMVFGELTIDKKNYKAFLRGEPLSLTLKEFELLSYLANHQGQVMKRDLILEQIWGYEYFGETRTVDVHIRHLREKLEDNSKRYIETVRGVGYRFIGGQ